MMITVIADDITGAAEIAGIAKTAGLDTLLVMSVDGVCDGSEDGVSVGSENSNDSKADVVVIATDTRQMSEADAVKEVGTLAKNVPSRSFVFKKTDSVLRGHIKAECQAILENTDYDQVLLVPQNPSKGRVVRDGLYYINDVLLNETQFAHDPEFPAKTADVRAFGVPDAESVEQIAEIVKAAKPRTLFAGGADLFKMSLDNWYHSAARNRGRRPIGKAKSSPYNDQKEVSEEQAEHFLMVCGSTQSKSVIDTPLCRRYNAVECNMPDGVFLGKEGAEAWIASLKPVFAKSGVVLTINYPSQGGKDFAVRLRKTMAIVVKALVCGGEEKAAAIPRLKLIIEGGATAFEILSTLGWSTFDVEKEHYPGVVKIANEKASIILKPGSYPWKGLLHE